MKNKTIIVLALVILIAILTFWFINGKINLFSGNIIEDNILEHELDIVDGFDSAPLTVFMYSSYNCHFCKKFLKDTYPKLKSEYIDKGEIKFSIKLIDLTSDDIVKNSLKIAVCINEYGNIEPLNRLLIVDSGVIYTKEFSNMVDEFIEEDIFIAECMINGYADKYIINNLIEFKQLELTGTPTFIINNHIYKGYKDFTLFQKIIENELLNL